MRWTIEGRANEAVKLPASLALMLGGRRVVHGLPFPQAQPQSAPQFTAGAKRLKRRLSSAAQAVLGLVCLTTAALGQGRGGSSDQDWALVRSVPDGNGRTMEFVVVPDLRKGDRAHYEEIANTICGSRTACEVFFWTHRDRVPMSAWMSGPGLTEMTAQYERHPTYKAPVLRLACWLYATKAEGEGAKCFYLPGARVPWVK